LETDTIEKLIDEAHSIFSATSIFEVIDLDKQAAIDFLSKTYDNPEAESIDRYLGVVDQLGDKMR
jgi:hypothetical protein